LYQPALLHSTDQFKAVHYDVIGSKFGGGLWGFFRRFGHVNWERE